MNQKSTNNIKIVSIAIVILALLIWNIRPHLISSYEILTGKRLIIYDGSIFAGVHYIAEQDYVMLNESSSSGLQLYLIDLEANTVKQLAPGFMGEKIISNESLIVRSGDGNILKQIFLSHPEEIIVDGNKYIYSNDFDYKTTHKSTNNKLCPSNETLTAERRPYQIIFSRTIESVFVETYKYTNELLVNKDGKNILHLSTKSSDPSCILVPNNKSNYLYLVSTRRIERISYE